MPARLRIDSYALSNESYIFPLRRPAAPTAGYTEMNPAQVSRTNGAPAGTLCLFLSEFFLIGRARRGWDLRGGFKNQVCRRAA